MLSEAPGELQDLQAVCQRLEDWLRESCRDRIVEHAIQELVQLCRTTIQQCTLHFADSHRSSQDGSTGHPLLMFEGLTLQLRTRTNGCLDHDTAFLANQLEECKSRIREVLTMLERKLSQSTEELQRSEINRLQEEGILKFAHTLDAFRHKRDDDLWKSTSPYVAKKMRQLRMDGEGNILSDLNNFMEYLLKWAGRSLGDNSSLSDTDADRDELDKRFANSL